MGFIVCPNYAELIISGQKKHEFRSRRTTILNKPVYLLSKGKVYGIIQFLKCDCLEHSYAWTIEVLKKYTNCKSYQHPKGAIVWIKEVKIK